jgi:mannose-1-phosphate guanylyltransferase
MSKNHYAIIMAGGIGSRFWPLSTPDFPKQFHDMTGTGRSLLQNTFDRLAHFIPNQNIYVLTQERYRDMIMDQLGSLITVDQIVCEPDRRNTAPCILLATLKISKLNPEAKIVVTPSDHLIEDRKLFQRDMALALEAADRQNLITFGIRPHFPATGFGYVAVKAEDQSSSLKTVVEFTEKPNLATAQKFLEAKKYYWNSGIFVWSAKALLAGFEVHAPELYHLFLKGYEFFNTPQEKEFVFQHYPLAQNISIDYALMEKSEHLHLIPARFDWNDLGSWKSLYDRMPKDESQNVIINSQLYAMESGHNLVKTASGKKVILAGMKDFIIVDTDEVLMICPMKKDQDIKEFAAGVQKKFDRKKD